MTYDFFIASRYRNKNEVLELAGKIREAGKSVYCFIEAESSLTNCGAVDCDPEIAMKKFESIPDWRNDLGIREIFESDMDALRTSTAVILLLPAGKSAHIEAGTAYGLGKPLFLIGEQTEAESLYLIFNEMFDSIDDFIKFIRQK